jgi:hypothetical protein
MLYGMRVIVDQPLYHRSVVRIGLPYTGPLFLWCARGLNWTWDLEFVEVMLPPQGTPDAAFAWGIHQVHPHPPEKMANWLPNLGCLLDPQLTAPMDDSVKHAFHSDHMQIRIDLGGVDLVTGNPIYDIKITFAHRAGPGKPDFDTVPRHYWDWLLGLFGPWASRPIILSSMEPPSKSRREELENNVRRHASD